MNAAQFVYFGMGGSASALALATILGGTVGTQRKPHCRKAGPGRRHIKSHVQLWMDALAKKRREFKFCHSYPHGYVVKDPMKIGKHNLLDTDVLKTRNNKAYLYMPSSVGGWDDIKIARVF